MSNLNSLTKQEAMLAAMLDNDVDLKEIVLIVWNKKLFISSFVAIAIILSSVFISMQPNVYAVQATFKMRTVPAMLFGDSTEEVFSYLSSEKIQNEIALISGRDSLGLTIERRKDNLIVKKQGENSQEIFDEISDFSKHANDVYLKKELGKVKSYIEILNKILAKDHSPETQTTLIAEHSRLIYIEAILESGTATLVEETIPAVKPSSYKKSKHALIIFLTALLGGMLSIFIVVIQHGYKKKKYQQAT